MKLLYFDLTNRKKIVYICNLKLSDFLSFIGLETTIKLKTFFGYNSEKYFYNSDLPDTLTSQLLLSFIRDNEIKNINSIDFEVNKINIEITDCYQYQLETEVSEENFFRKIVLSATGFVIPVGKELDALQNNYLVVERGEIIEMFNNFDDYLKSNYGE